VACIEQGNSASGVAVMVILDEGGHCFQASDRFYLSCVRCDAMRCDAMRSISISISFLSFRISFGRSRHYQGNDNDGARLARL
jgi:hypothetical protein